MSTPDRTRRAWYELAGRCAPPTRPPTAREIEVFLAVCRFGGQKQAAHELGLGLQSVKNHCNRLYRKLGAENYLSATIALGWTVLPSDLSTSGLVAVRG